MAEQGRIPEPEIEAALEGLPGWKVLDAKLHREYRFADFVHAFAFIAAAAALAQAMGHHPEWSNVYNRVTVDLTTHDAGGITAKDLALAARLEQIARKLE